MSYINTQTGQYPISEQQIRNENPNTSFPILFVPPDEYALVFTSPQPEHNQVIQFAREVAPEMTVKGHYEQRWEILSKFSEYTDDAGAVHSVAEQEANALTADAKEKAKRLIDTCVTNTQQRLDTWAKERNYDGILSLCTYATSSNSRFAIEGQRGVDNRDATWSKLYQILADVESGIRPVPNGYVDIESELPELVWPQ